MAPLHPSQDDWQDDDLEGLGREEDEGSVSPGARAAIERVAAYEAEQSSQSSVTGMVTRSQRPSELVALASDLCVGPLAPRAGGC